MSRPETGHSVLTVADLLGLDEFRSGEVTVAAGGHRLGNRVEWVHVFETPAIAGMLRGGEFLLTTGIALAGYFLQNVKFEAAAPDRGTRARVSPVAGLMTSCCWPAVAATQRPPT